MMTTNTQFAYIAEETKEMSVANATGIRALAQ